MFSFIISIVVNIGCGLKDLYYCYFTHRDYLPSSWTMFSPTFVDIGIFIGTIGFLCFFLLYSRTFPVIAQAEVKRFERTDNYKEKEQQIKIHIMSNKVIYAIYNDDDILMDAVKKLEQLIIILKKFYTISGSRFDKAMGFSTYKISNLCFHLWLCWYYICNYNDELHNDSRLASRYWR
jgi:molybdopterin-containing oxidoreductase family membrane subunit